MPTSNQLTGQALSEINEEVRTVLGTEPADGAALIAALRTADQQVAFQNERLKQMLVNYKQQMLVKGGQLDGAAITLGGTGYAIGDILPVTGTTGSGGSVIVTSVAAGVIDGVAVHHVGENYTGTITVDASVAGNGDATITATASYEEQSVIAEALAAL